MNRSCNVGPASPLQHNGQGASKSEFVETERFLRCGDHIAGSFNFQGAQQYARRSAFCLLQPCRCKGVFKHGVHVIASPSQGRSSQLYR